MLETKANKSSVANALHKKANKNDITTMLSLKVDTVLKYIILINYK